MLRHTTALLTLTCLTALSLATGCATRSNVVSGSQVVSQDAMLDAGHRVLWRTDLNLPGRSSIAAAEILDDVIVIVEHPNNLVSVFDTDSGNRRWSARAGSGRDLAFTPVRIGDSLYVPTETDVYEFNLSNGNQRSRRPLISTPSTSPTVQGDALVFGGTTGLTWAQDRSSGQAVWRQQMVGKIAARPVLVDGTRIFVADTEGNLAMINANGQKEWTGRTFGAVTAQAMPLGIGLYVPSTDQGLYALSVANGQDRWPAFRSPVPLTEPPFAAGVTLFVPIPGQDLVALETTRGNELWRLGEPAKPLVVDGDRLLIQASDRLAFLNIETGNEVETLPTASLVASYLTEDRHLIAVSRAGSLLSIALD